MACAVGPGLLVGLCRDVGGTPARAKLGCNAHPWHWVLIHGCAWVCTCVRVLWGTRESRLEMGYGQIAWATLCLLWPLSQLPVSQA